MLNSHGITLAHELGHHLGLNHNYSHSLACPGSQEEINCLDDNQYYLHYAFEFRLKEHNMRRDCQSGNWVIYDNMMGNLSDPYEESLKENVYRGFTFDQRNFMHTEALTYGTWVRELKNSDK
jgi:hypothetical protein